MSEDAVHALDALTIDAWNTLLIEDDTEALRKHQVPGPDGSFGGGP